MEKEFISYEQALALKQLGFNEPCFANWIKRDSRDGGGIVLEMLGDERTEYMVISEILAPTFSQAFKFFREKYNLFHSITEYNKDGSLIIEVSKDRVEIFRKMTNFDFTEYEEAELECLKKLIEICKKH